ncbi:MAG: S1 RNA-binding domain-containing protein [Candidatus Goldbacteria bacterium]|nr:S1 RNA-binding domain-containing protein [Candidatus Goldiibacteriota bacterium]
MEDFNYILKEGSIVKGKVIKITEEQIYIDIGYKKEGVIPKEEVVRYNYLQNVQVGDELEVFIKKLDKNLDFILLSKIIADKKNVFNRVKKAYKDNVPIEATVIKMVKSGFIVDFGANVTGFLPMSHSKAYGKDLTAQKLQFKIIALEEDKKNIVVSYKEYFDEKLKKEQEKINKIFPVGEKVKVLITNLKENGIEITKDDMTVFIPVHELSYRRYINIPEVFKVNEEIETLVLSNENGEIKLSVKRNFPNPFEIFQNEKKQGDKTKIKILEITKDGAYVDVDGVVDGFLPVGEISYYRRIKNIEEVYKKGDVSDAVIIKMDENQHLVIVSVKRLEKNPWHNIEERYPVGARVVGTVKEIIEGEGVLIELEENFDAFMHISNISWFNFVSISDILKIGDKKEFKILGFDKNKYRILLGLKQLSPSPWSSFINKYKEGSFIDVKITDIEDNYIICQIVEGVFGRIFIKNKSKVKYKKGDIINVKITKIDKEQKKVVLFAKDIEITEEKKQLDEYIKSHEHTFKMDDIANFDNVRKEEQK